MKRSKLILSLFCFALLFMNTQCDDEDVVEEPCGQTVVIDSGFFESAESGFYNLISADIEGNCLNINVSASGCDGSTWSMVLVDSGAVAESSPEQRFLKFVFTNQEVCLAVFTQERSFDLSSLQVSGSNEIILNIEDFPEALTYSY
ncbi:hypothetical protein [Psychroserpens sp. MEBiC05023]